MGPILEDAEVLVVRAVQGAFAWARRVLAEHHGEGVRLEAEVGDEEER